MIRRSLEFISVFIAAMLCAMLWEYYEQNWIRFYCYTRYYPRCEFGFDYPMYIHHYIQRPELLKRFQSEMIDFKDTTWRVLRICGEPQSGKSSLVRDYRRFYPLTFRIDMSKPDSLEKIKTIIQRDFTFLLNKKNNFIANETKALIIFDNIPLSMLSKELAESTTFISTLYNVDLVSTSQTCGKDGDHDQSLRVPSFTFKECETLLQVHMGSAEFDFKRTQNISHLCTLFNNNPSMVTKSFLFMRSANIDINRFTTIHYPHIMNPDKPIYSYYASMVTMYDDIIHDALGDCQTSMKFVLQVLSFLDPMSSTINTIYVENFLIFQVIDALSKNPWIDVRPDFLNTLHQYSVGNLTRSEGDHTMQFHPLFIQALFYKRKQNKLYESNEIVTKLVTRHVLRLFTGYDLLDDDFSTYQTYLPQFTMFNKTFIEPADILIHADSMDTFYSIWDWTGNLSEQDKEWIQQKRNELRPYISQYGTEENPIQDNSIKITRAGYTI